MKKKVLSILLSAVMVASVFAGCGNKADETTTTPSESSEAEPAADDAADADASVEESSEATGIDVSSLEPVTLKWYLHGSSVTDDAAVLEKANAYLQEKLNVTLEPIWGTWDDFNDGATMALNGGDDIDIYFTCSWSADEYNQFAKKGYFVKLDDLISQYATELWNTLPEVLVTGATIPGADGIGVYAIPGYKDCATQLCWDVNVTLLEELGYSLSDIEGKTYFEFGDILQAAKDAKGESFYPLLVEGAVLERMVNNVSIVAGDAGTNNVLSLYLNAADPSAEGPYGDTVVNKFATDEYKAFVEKTREYYLAGYIDPAMGNAQQANSVREAKQKSAEYLIGTQSYALGYEIQASNERGIEVAFVPTTDPYVDTTVSQGAMMAVSTASKNPERAVMFLNLLNTDPYLMTLLNYGVEGVHYDLDEDGLVVFTEERANYTPWRNGMGNITLLPPQKEEGVGYFENTFIPYYAGAKSTPALGFVLDQANIETEMAALANIANEYALALSAGTIDPAEKLPEFLEKLEAAGMQKVLDEANAQLSTLLAGK